MASDLTPAKENKRSRDMVSPLNAVSTNPEKRMCSDNVNTESVRCSPAPMHPDDIAKIAQELKSLMTPELKSLVAGPKHDLPDIQAIIQETVTKAVSAVKEQYDSVISSLKAENAKLAAKCEVLETKLAQCVSANDDLEQYSRRNCLSISGVPQHDDESTDNIVLEIAKKINANINLTDIDRTHRVGTKAVKDIIVKFTSYRSRREFISKRKALKDNPDQRYRRVFINENLTASRNKLLYEARQLVKAKRLLSAYSIDGRIFVVDDKKHRHLISCLTDLDKFKSNSASA